MAACVNQKLQELEDTESYRALPIDLKPTLVELNLADDLIQAQDTIDILESDLQLKEKELAEVKQALVEAQMKLESLEESYAKLEEERNLQLERTAEAAHEA